jgi:hypothetical protein
MLAVLIPTAGHHDPKPGQVKQAAAADIAKMGQEDPKCFRRAEASASPAYSRQQSRQHRDLIRIASPGS